MYKLMISVIVLLLMSVSLSTAAEKAELGKAAPKFTLVDSKGGTHSLDNFAGKWVVLEWINFDCPFVVKHYKEKNMQNIQKQYTDKGVIWLGICSSAPGKQGNFDKNEINKRLSEMGVNMTAYLIDEDGTVGKKYEAKTTPHMFIINPEGELVYQGAIDSIRSTDIADNAKAENYVKKALDEGMSGKAISTKTSTPYGCSVKYAN
ncbi:MAG: thioredoxin family protein [Candidatus Kapabacteria bacterium]|nr:thioredoxin family protein [Candidatus Kapabacteria bacterium]